ncbi:CapA family protein, partial [Roseovarius sp. MMSF_3350]|uniref:CapA family protein n=1 Tax=Roseovarius sp. MMSF_3350 TaxID=3046706 RepID=UPI00273F8678
PPPARDLPLPADAVLAWGGAVNLGRRQHMRTAQLGAENVLDIPELRAADLAVVNLDCVVSTLGTQGVDKGEDGPFYYRARPEMLRVLTAAGIDAVAVANAHSGDYGPTALQQQHGILDALGIASTGSGANRQDAFAPVICRAGNVRVALLSVDTTQHRFAAGDDGFGTAYLSPRDPQAWRRVMGERIAAAGKQADIVLVSAHWPARSTPTADSDIRTLSHALVDAGAHGVLGTTGAHLHGIELYHGKPIIHGTGSLLSDTPRAWFRPGGLFRFGLGKTGIAWVEYVPVGIGDGFSQRLEGEAATRAIDSFDSACHALGTALTRNAEQAFVRVDPSAPRSGSTAAPAIRPSDRYRHDVLATYTPDAALGQAGFVPGDARIAPVSLNGLQLLGMRIRPSSITCRQMLWIETWWSSPKPVREDLRLSFVAIPQGSGEAAEWGRGTDHDPCDWMQPTSRWQPGRIYYDHYGLRPPAQEHIVPGALQIELRVLGQRPNSDCYLFPRPIPVEPPA